MWKYFGISQGIVWKYNPVTFDNNLKFVKPFSVTKSTNRYISTSSSKNSVTHEFCNLHFCLENGCSAAFDNQLQLEQNMFSEQHTFSTIKLGMDKAK